MTSSQAKAIANHHAALADVFRDLKRKDQAEYHEGMARIYERLVEEL